MSNESERPVFGVAADLALFEGWTDLHLDNFLGHVCHRIRSARTEGIAVPETLLERLAPMIAARGWGPHVLEAWPAPEAR